MLENKAIRENGKKGKTKKKEENRRFPERACP